MEILSPGDKIKKLRLELGLKQEEITNEKVSKSLISMIEKNKRGLTWNVATIIANSLNRYYASMEKVVTAEYLMETEIERVKKEIEEERGYLHSIVKSNKINEKLFNMAFDKLMALAKEWHLKKEIMDLLLLRGEFHYYTYQYNDAIKDYSEVLVYQIETKNYTEVARLYNLIGTSYYMLLLIDQAVYNFTKANEIAVEHNTPNRTRIEMEATINLVLSYRKIQRYDMAIQYISKQKYLDGDNPAYEKYVDEIVLLEANTYRDLRNYDRADKLYDRLLQKALRLDKNVLFLLYENFATFYLEQNKTTKALRYTEKAFKLMDEIQLNYVPSIHLTHSRCQLMLNNPEQALNTLKKGLVLAEEINRTNMIIDLNFAIIQVYISLKDYEMALEFLRKAEEIIIAKNVKVKQNDLYTFYSEVYLGLSEDEKCREYMIKNRKDYLIIK